MAVSGREERGKGGIGICRVLFGCVLFHVVRVRAVRGFRVLDVLLFVLNGGDVLLPVLTLKWI